MLRCVPMRVQRECDAVNAARLDLEQPPGLQAEAGQQAMG